ncbi:MAG: very short patch repair endonuclease [Gammaproteobacteria bacterium RIFCSPLOWO2_02_FULL_57_10]|nr:MAG: very short patch repair endonuclease [Gammaproteobacteria bacterium RIFCSPLOWO2_02_FULL_57_10]
MSRIKGKDTKPELLIRSMLHRRGFRFRLHSGQLPGRPDIILPKYKTVIFVHGCYWHRHEGCPYAYTPKSNQEFWLPKLEQTVRRDRLKTLELQQMGWEVLTVWECQIKKHPEEVVTQLTTALLHPD